MNGKLRFIGKSASSEKAEEVMQWLRSQMDKYPQLLAWRILPNGDRITVFAFDPVKIQIDR